MGEFMALSQQLVMQVSPELRALLKVALKDHPKLQAMLIDVQQYKPLGLWRAYLLCLGN